MKNSILKLLMLSLGAMYFFHATSVWSFVLISPVDESRLPATRSSPTITFYWNGTHPDEFIDIGELTEIDLEGLSPQATTQKLLELAMRYWNDIPGSFLVLKLQRQERESESVTPPYRIFIEDQNSYSSVGFALPTFKGSVISQCVIRIGQRPVRAKSFTYTMIHELGHCIGLGHNHVNSRALMGYTRNDSDLKLGASDKAGAIYLYPTYEYSDCAVVLPKISTRMRFSLNWCCFLLPILILLLIRFSINMKKI